MASSSLKEFGRLVNGLSLVAKEAAKQSSPHRDLQSLIKKALLSFTDLSGLTKGKLRQFSLPNNDNTYYKESSSSSVVYFADEEEKPPDLPAALHISSSDLQAQREKVEVDLIPSNSRQVTATHGGSIHASPSAGGLESSSANANALAAAGAQGEESAAPVTTTTTTPQPQPPSLKKKKRTPREKTVPSTSFSRALGFASLGAGLAWGTFQESAKRLVFGTSTTQDKQSALSPFLSEKNADRLALALCRMRGAALKLGQMLSIQDESLVPAPILAALDIVRQGADVMPRSQLNQVLDAELGPDWSSKLMSFDYQPIAAASIGQVHQAVTKDGLEVAMKIQYPGIADSIDSDIENVQLLLKYTNLIPEKLYLDNAMKVAKEELSRECDYKLEAANQKRFRNLLSNTKGFYVPMVVDDLSSKRVLTSELVPENPCCWLKLLQLYLHALFRRKAMRWFMQLKFSFGNFNIVYGYDLWVFFVYEVFFVAKEELSRECDYKLEAANQKRFRNLLSNTKGFYVPMVVDDLSSKRVLTSELVPGIPIDKVALLDQETRNYVGKKLLELTLTELFVFRFMQTDPNWSNFLYDVAARSINLIDFGAAQDYPRSFVDDYLRMVLACANSEREAVIEMSERLGFLTGMESEIMLEAHVQAAFVVGLPFSKPGGYDFRSTSVTQSISNIGATMLRHRLTPPPKEAYSLHRKLSGAFLACIKLGAVVPCRELLLDVYKSYQFSEDGEILPTASNSQ
ncbi:unnamed protein product [Ilex paraguariensis]|uniref:ABC1 atypical kinase-like domain-containing protein n=1 Tax=Ilex paraguariensis TaxID=185542 RepID=A0ABC8RJZ3_9AQUA